MIAIDTNIVVRVLANDEPRQVARARRLLSENDVVLLTTVALECEWVLRALYDVPRERIVTSLTAFCALPSVNLEEPERLERALKLYEHGLDFADALHIAGIADGGSFASFDKAARNKAAKLVASVSFLEP